MARFPLTPTLSPLGRGSPAVPEIEFVLITKVCVDMNGTCFSLRRDLAGGATGRPVRGLCSRHYCLVFFFARLRRSLRLRCCFSSRALSFSLVLSNALSHSSLSPMQYAWQPTRS